MQQARKEFGHDVRVSVWGQVNPLTPLMAAADVLVTKSGGLTSTEAMTIGTAIVVAHPIAGCETENARMMEEKGLALWAHEDEELAPKVSWLLRNPAEREKLIAHQRAFIDPDCALHIADILIQKTAERMGRRPQ